MPDPNSNINQTTHINTSAYNPYNGSEVLDIIMKRIYAVLKAHQDFGAHLAYTKFDHEFTLSFKGESIEPTIIKGKEVHELRQVSTDFTVNGDSPKAPDEGRRDAGLFVPAPALTAGGMVDIPLQHQPASNVPIFTRQ